MDLDITTDDNGVPHVDRLQFTKAVVDSISKYLDGEVFRVVSSNINSVTIKYQDGTTDTFNLTDQMDPELQLLVYVAVSSVNYALPKIMFHLADNDGDGDLDITGFSLEDFHGIVLGTGDPDYDFSLELGARYLKNLFRLKGLMSFAADPDAKPKNLPLQAKPESAEDLAQAEFEAMYGDGEKSEAITTLAQLHKRAATKHLRDKHRMMLRTKNPALHRARALRARLNWRRNRQAMLKGIRRFHRSAQGKRLHRLMAQFRSQQRAKNKSTESTPEHTEKKD